MTDQSVREAVARAVRETVRLNERATWLDTADAALAAVADHDGLADAFWQTIDLSREDCERLADVVRAWLLDQA